MTLARGKVDRILPEIERRIIASPSKSLAISEVVDGIQFERRYLANILSSIIRLAPHRIGAGGREQRTASARLAGRQAQAG
jgi:hypothetical protein